MSSISAFSDCTEAVQVGVELVVVDQLAERAVAAVHLARRRSASTRRSESSRRDSRSMFSAARREVVERLRAARASRSVVSAFAVCERGGEVARASVRSAARFSATACCSSSLVSRKLRSVCAELAVLGQRIARQLVELRGRARCTRVDRAAHAGHHLADARARRRPGWCRARCRAAARWRRSTAITFSPIRPTLRIATASSSWSA